jgi:hypothetical protein
VSCGYKVLKFEYQLTAKVSVSISGKLFLLFCLNRKLIMALTPLMAVMSKGKSGDSLTDVLHALSPLDFAQTMEPFVEKLRTQPSRDSKSAQCAGD